MSDTFNAALEKATVKKLAREPRRHLGASQIGNECALQIWLSFRWAGFEEVPARMLRLWNRGHDEEHNLVAWLRELDIGVQDYQTRLMYDRSSDKYINIDWEEDVRTIPKNFRDVHDNPTHIKRATKQNVGPRQWNFSDHEGHFKGSTDGRLDDKVSLYFTKVKNKGYGLAEFKTHNDESYKKLIKEGVARSKPVHYIQMQIYMHYLDLEWCLYMSVNKNDDSIYSEVVFYNEVTALYNITKAKNIIFASEPPKKITHDPSWYKCRFCTFKDQCHYRKRLENECCRSCRHSNPVENGRWKCSFYDKLIPIEFESQKCDEWSSCL